MHLFLLAVLITVTGQGHASAQPDTAYETFTITSNARSGTQAASDNNARYESLLSKLQALGIAKTDIRTASYNLYFAQPPTEPSGFFVNRSVSVTLHNLTQTGSVIDAAVAAGVTDVGGVSYGISDSRAMARRATGEAVADARAQADAMAQAAGLHITRVHSMQQGYASLPQPAPMMRSTADVSPPTQIEPSSVQASASVTVVYEAQ